jgi:hypothetical protein
MEGEGCHYRADVDRQYEAYLCLLADGGRVGQRGAGSQVVGSWCFGYVDLRVRVELNEVSW